MTEQQNRKNLELNARQTKRRKFLQPARAETYDRVNVVPAAERGESSQQPPPDQAFLQEDTFNIQRYLISSRTLRLTVSRPTDPQPAWWRR